MTNSSRGKSEQNVRQEIGQSLDRILHTLGRSLRIMRDINKYISTRMHSV